MRPAPAQILALVLSAVSAGAQTSAELGAQLLRNISREEVEARTKETPGGVIALQQAAVIVRDSLGGEGVPFIALKPGVLPETAAELLKDFPVLAKEAQEWAATNRKEYESWKDAICREMETPARALLAKLRDARKPADLDETLEQLRKVVARYPYDRQAQSWQAWVTCARSIDAVLTFAYSWQRLLAAEAAGEKREAAALLANLAATQNVPLFSGSDLIALLGEAARRIGIPSMDEAEEVVRAAIEKAIVAKNATELDEPLKQMQRAQALWERAVSRDGQSRIPRRAYEIGAGFLSRWQEYLVFRAAGESSRARSIVQSLASTAASEPLYPRAKLLEIAAAVEASPQAAVEPSDFPAEKILDAIKSPDDIARNLNAFAVAAEKDMSRYHTVDNDLEELAAAAAALRRNELNGVQSALSGGFDKHPKIPELRAQLRVVAVAVLLGADGDLAPKPGESADQLARRLAADAGDRKDWRRVRQILEAPLHQFGLRNVFNAADAPAMRAFFAARNLEEAGIWSEAVAAYVTTLKGGSAFTPAEDIKQRLEAIRREHPPDFERGVGLAESNKVKTP